MSVQDTFISSITTCLNPDFQFPSISERGLPNFALGTFLGTMAGINYLLDFLPPNPNNLPSLPTISIFTNAFLGGINMPAIRPGISLGALTIPAVGDPPYEFDMSGQLKLIACVIVLPFQLISDIITGIINNLTVALPSLQAIKDLFASLAATVGLPLDVVTGFGSCLATAIFNLFAALIPV